MVPSGAVTLTLIVFAPTASATWKPLAASASVSAWSLPSRYSTVAVVSLAVASTVVEATEFAAVAV